MFELQHFDSPLRTKPTEAVLVRRGTVAEMLRQAYGSDNLGQHCDVSVKDIPIPRELWTRVRIKEGSVLKVTMVPAGDSGKKVLRTVAMIALAAVAAPLAGFAAAGLTFGGATVLGMGAAALTSVLTAGITMFGSLLLNALIPPPKPNGMLSQGQEQPLNFLTGTQNAFNPFGVVPYVIGEARWFPPYAAKPFTEAYGQTQYMTCMFELGDGDMEIEDVKIGPTLLAEPNYKDFQTEFLRPGEASKLFRYAPTEEGVGANLIEGAPVVRSLSPYIDHASLDIAFPNGLFGVDKKGNPIYVTATASVQYREIGSSTWLAVPGGVNYGYQSESNGMTLAGAIRTSEKKPFVATLSWGLDNTKAYEVQVTYSVAWGAISADNRVGAAQWTVLRSFRHRQPAHTDTNRFVLRIKATAQINGQLDSLNLVSRQKYPIDGGAAQFTCNPAWITYHLLNACESTGIRAPAHRMDDVSFRKLAEFADTHDFEVRGVVDTEVRLEDLLDDLLATTLGARTMRTGRYGVMFDDGQQPVEMTLHPYLVRDFEVSRAFIRLPHAVRARFKNADMAWQDDEIVVPRDGYSWRGRDARGNISTAPEATEFETVDYRWAKFVQHIWKLTRMHQAQAEFRGVGYDWQMDVANWMIRRGFVVKVGHDVPAWGHTIGRVEDVKEYQLWITERGHYDLSKAYKAQIIHADGTEDVITVVPDSEFTAALNFTAPNNAAEGDVVIVGESETVERKLLVTGIRGGADMSGAVTAVDFSDSVFPYWQGVPASIISEISGGLIAPGKPKVEIIVSDPINDTNDDAAIREAEVHITFGYDSGNMDLRDFRSMQ